MGNAIRRDDRWTPIARCVIDLYRTSGILLLPSSAQADSTYRLAVGPTVRAGSATQGIYYAANIAAAPAGGNTVTVNFLLPALSVDIRISEYRGIATSNPVDVTAAATGNSTFSNSGAVTTANANDLLVGANTVATRTTGAGAGYTSRIITTRAGRFSKIRS